MTLLEGDRVHRIGWRALVLLIPVVVAAYHWRAALPGMAFAGPDLRDFLPVREAVADSLRHGRLPGWQRGIFLGYPLLADPHAAALDLATWLTLPWNGPRALTLGTLLHLTVAGWGMALWMRLRGLRPAEGLLAALLFALGAKETVNLFHWNSAASVAWWPWMLAGLEGFATRTKGRWLLVASLATAASWFGGSPQLACLGTLVAGLYALVLAPSLWRRSRVDAVLALASIPLGLVLAAPLILPASELACLGPRWTGGERNLVHGWRGIGHWALSLFVLPKAYGGLPAGPAGVNLSEAAGYLGILPLGLAAAAPLRRQGVWFFAVVAVLGVLVAFGDGSWFGLPPLLPRLLPGDGSLESPTGLLFVTSFASAALAATGLHALRETQSYRARAARAGAVLAIAGALAVVLPRLPVIDAGGEAARRTAWIALGLACTGLAWLAAGFRLGRGTPWALAASALFLTDAYLAFGAMNEVAPAAAERSPLSEFGPLAPGHGERVGVIAGRGHIANAALPQGWEGVTGHGPTYIQRVRSLVEATQDGRVAPLGPTREDTRFPLPRADSPLWRFFAAPLVISDQPQPLPRLATAGRRGEEPLVAYRAQALPRVYWVGSWTAMDDTRAAGPMLQAARGDRAVVSEPVRGMAPGAPRGPIAADSVRVGPSWLEATVTAPRGGLVVVLDPFYPGWNAKLDGRPVPILRANLAFEAVPVARGRHALRLEYRDRLLPLGSGAALGALLILGAVLAWRRRAAVSSPATR